MPKNGGKDYMSKINKGFNMATEDLEVALINVINQSGLPISVAKLILDRVAVKVNNQLSVEIQNERKIYQDAIDKENTDETNDLSEKDGDK